VIKLEKLYLCCYRSHLDAGHFEILSTSAIPWMDYFLCCLCLCCCGSYSHHCTNCNR